MDGDGFGDFLVGAFSYDTPGTDAGKVWIYRGTADGPSTTSSWSGEGDQAGANFGMSVASAGDVNGDGYGDLIVGAPLYDNGEADEGQAFLFIGSSGGGFLSPSWTAQGDQASGVAGYAVAGKHQLVQALKGFDTRRQRFATQVG